MISIKLFAILEKKLVKFRSFLIFVQTFKRERVMLTFPNHFACVERYCVQTMENIDITLRPLQLHRYVFPWFFSCESVIIRTRLTLRTYFV